MKNICTVLAVLLFTLTSFAGGRFYVTTSGSDSNDGKSWVKAFKDVQTAIDAAAAVATDESPSEVWIAKGTYKHGSSLVMKNNVAIYGGFAGNETSLDARASGNATILDGENLDYHVIHNENTEANPLTSSAKLDSVGITNGKYGIYNLNFSSPTIENCVINGNRWTGICNYGGSSPTITNCSINANVESGIINDTSCS
ncbi:MAG: hypothetical protein IKO42_02480, partial [Opitutales bacterium]|nr:hypothetical protein [Opitutales bacterium]